MCWFINISHLTWCSNWGDLYWKRTMHCNDLRYWVLFLYLFHWNIVSEYIKMGLDEDFAAAAEDISNNVNKTLTDDELKEVYALYKQGTIGDVNTSRCNIVNPYFLPSHHGHCPGRECWTSRARPSGTPGRERRRWVWLRPRRSTLLLLLSSKRSMAWRRKCCRF